MPLPGDEHTGTRIAHHRKRAGLTQRGLTQRVPYSYSLLTQVESGHKPASPDLVAAVAKALSIDVTALTGQPYVTELQQDRLAALVRPIREALDLYDLGADPAITPRPTPQLVAAAEALCQLVRATKLHDAAVDLPDTIAEITTAANRSPSSVLWAALSSTYRTAHDLAVKLGYYDLSTVALDRMDWAASRASDPLLSAVRQYMRALVTSERANTPSDRGWSLPGMGYWSSPLRRGRGRPLPGSFTLVRASSLPVRMMKTR